MMLLGWKRIKLESTNSKLFNWILGLSALAISGMAAFFSVTGIAMLFSGSFLAVALMATSLEVGKLVTASFLYRYWNIINWIQKTYMVTAAIVLIGITSMGIFGFLSNSYMGASQNFNSMITKLDVYKDQLVTLKEDKEFLKDELEQAVNSLPSNYITAKRNLRNEYNPLITEKSTQIAELKNKIGQIEIEMVDTGVDVGPLLYIADAFDTDVDTAVKYIMFILILVFDPLAVMLVISLNIALVGGGNPTPRRGTPTKNYKKDFEKWKNVGKEKLKDFMTDFDKKVIKEDVVKGIGEVGDTIEEKEVVKEHIKDKLTQAVRDSVDPLEKWKRETEKQISDENYPHKGAGKGIEWEGREKDINVKPDDYDEKISTQKEEVPVVSVGGRLINKGQN